MHAQKNTSSELSRHSTKTSKQASLITLSLTNALKFLCTQEFIIRSLLLLCTLDCISNSEQCYTDIFMGDICCLSSGVSDFSLRVSTKHNFATK